MFTRNLNDVTDRVPEVVGSGRALDVRDRRARRRGDRARRRRTTRAVPGHDEPVRTGRCARPTARLSTRSSSICLHLDGEDLIDRPLHGPAGESSIGVPALDVPGIVTEPPRRGVPRRRARAGHEGVMVKARRVAVRGRPAGQCWRKVKPVRTLDLVVLAAEWGHGRRQGWLSNLHLGARDRRTARFVMVGKTFKGLTDDVARVADRAVPGPRDRREGITVYVRPELVVEIALDGVQVSTSLPRRRRAAFRPGQAVPRTSPADADTIDAVRALL